MYIRERLFKANFEFKFRKNLKHVSLLRYCARYSTFFTLSNFLSFFNYSIKLLLSFLDSWIQKKTNDEEIERERERVIKEFRNVVKRKFIASNKFAVNQTAF